MSTLTATVVTVRIVLGFEDMEAEPGALMFGQSHRELVLPDPCTIAQAIEAMQAFKERHGVE